MNFEIPQRGCRKKGFLLEGKEKQSSQSEKTGLHVTGSDVSECLSLHKVELIDEWNIRVRRDSAPSSAEAPSGLRTYLPGFIDRIVSALNRDAALTHYQIKTNVFADLHKQVKRELDGCRLSEVIRELQILRQVFIDLLRRESPFSESECNAISNAIDEVIRQSVESYVEDCDLLENQLRLEVMKLRNEMKESKPSREDGIKDELLYQSEAKFRTLLENVPQFIWRINADGEAEFFSREFERYTGFRVEDAAMGVQYRKVVHPDDMALTHSTLKAAKESKSTFNFLQRIRRFDGQYRWHQARGVPLFDDTGELQGWIGTTTDIHESKLSEESARQREAHFKDFADALPQIMWTADSNGIVDWYNSWWYEFLGLPPGTKWNDPELNPMHPDDVMHTNDIWPKTVAARKPFHFEQRFRRGSDGQYRWHMVRGVPVFDSKGQLLKYVGANTDIHDHKMTEEALRKSESELRTLMELAPHVVFTNNPDGTEFWINKQWSDFTGLPMQAANHYGYVEIIHPEDRERTLTNWRSALERGEPYQGEHRLRSQNGIYHWFIVRARPLKDAKGHIQRWVGVMSDIDALKRAEVSAKLAEQRFEVALKNAPLVVYMNDLDLRYTWIHNIHHDFIDPESIIGKRDDEILNTTGTEEVMNLKRQVIQSGIGARKVVTLGLPSGDQTYDFTIEPTRNEQGQVEGLIVAALEVTDINRSKRAAEAASDAKSAFLANMSHEIRTPMTAVLGFTEILRDNELTPEEHHDALKRIENSGRALLRLIDDVLDISKIEAGKLEIQHIPFSPVAVVSDVIALLKLTAERKGLSLKMKIHPDVPSFACSDPTRIRQILVNLIGNAIKFTSDGQVVVSVKAEENAFLIFEVCDTGIGISDEDQVKLFQPFAQADESITRKFGGTGLGLLLSRRLAERMGGSLSLLESKEGEGSRFIARILAKPFEWDQASSVHDKERTEVKSQSSQKPLQGLQLLIAEDVEDNRLLMDLYLRNSGAFVTFAIDGSEALDKARSTSFDLILMDIQMPNIDGIQATRVLRGDGYSGPIVALTAHAMTEEVQRSLSAGCNGHLTKPISKAALHKAILQYTHKDLDLMLFGAQNSEG